jgi:tetratricopeptide (TPR) repeat protein
MASFFDRLKERKLFQWALAYAAGAWALLEGVDLVGGQFGWPTRLLQSVTILVAVGFFVVLVLAWYHGERGQQRVSGRELLILTVVLAFGGGLLAALGDPEAGSEPAVGGEGAGVSAPDAIPSPREGVNRVSLILADFENHTTDPHLGLMTTEALRVDLAGSRRLAVLERSSLAGALRRMEVDPSTPLTRDVAVEIAQREGVPFVVAGQVDAVGGAIQFLAELIRPGEDTSAGGRRVVASDSTEILSAIGELSKGLRADAGESARSVSEAGPLPEITTRSFEALQLYARAVRLGDEGDYPRAVELLERAVAVDTSFAMAYLRLGAYVSNIRTDRTLQVESFRRAYLLRDRLTEPERLLAEDGYQCCVTGDVKAVLDATRTMVELYPDHRTGLQNLGSAYGRLGRHEQAAAAFRRAFEIDPTSFSTLGNLTTHLIALGELDVADQVIDEFDGASPDHWGVLWRRSEVEKARENYGAAEEHLLTLANLPPPTGFATTVLAGARRRLYQRRGQVANALAQAAELRRLRMSEGVPGEAILEASHEANLHSRLLGDQTTAEAVLDQALADHPLAAIGPHDVPYLDLIEAYAWAGRPDRSRALHAEYEQRVPSDERGARREVPGEQPRVLSQVALAAGDSEESIGLLRDARDLYCHPARCAVLLSIAHDAAARPDSAIAWYEKYLDTFRRAEIDDEYLAPVLERLAQLHDEHGDPARAEALYTRFVDLWEEADPELQPRVEAAKARLRR